MAEAQSGVTPAALALLNWKQQVGLLEQWEQDEIQLVYLIINSILHQYQSSAALAIARVGLEIGRLQGQ